MGISVIENELLAKHSTFKIGGPSRFFTSVATESELKQALAWSKDNRVDHRFIGGGSNILFSDDLYPGLTIKVEIKGIEWQEKNGQVRLTAGAGEVWDDLVRFSVEQGWFGLENLSGIPGTVGAAPVQNIGAYGSELKDTLVKVKAWDITADRLVELFNQDCNFSYRQSLFKQTSNYVVLSVTLNVSSSGQPVISYRDLSEKVGQLERSQLTPEFIRQAVLDIRSNKFPDLRTLGTAGSFFTNPIIESDHYERLQGRYPGLPGFRLDDGRYKVSLAWILDQVCGLKGYQSGSVALYQKQPLILVSQPGALAVDVKRLADEVALLVKAKTDISLEWEVTLM